MKDQTLAERYANALFQSATSLKIEQVIWNNLQAFSKALSHQDLNTVFESPLFEAKERNEVINQVLAQLEIHPISRNFVLLLLDKGRTSFFSSILDLYKKKLHTFHNEQVVQVLSSEPLQESYLQELKTSLETKLNQTVLMEEKVDSSLLGGVVVHIGNNVYDGSLKSKMSHMKKQLLQQIQ